MSEAEPTPAAATPAPAAKTRPSRDESHCSLEGCKRPYRAKGYCVTHYKEWRRGEMKGHTGRYKICTKEACRKPRAFGSLCAEHGKPAEVSA